MTDDAPTDRPVTVAMLRALRESSPRQTSEEARAQMAASLAASARANRDEMLDGTHPSRLAPSPVG